MTDKQKPQHTEASIARVLKYTGLFGGVQGIYVFISIVRNKLTTILLGPSGLGLIDMYNRTAELIGNSTNMGLSFSGIQHLSELADGTTDQITPQIDHFARLVRSWVMIAALLGLLLTVTLSPFWSYLSLGTPRHATMFIGLGPLVALLTLTGGELAILRGLRRLKTIALITTLGALTTLAVTVPVYYWLDTYGIVPALVASAGLIFLMHLVAASRVVPYKVSLLSWRFLRRGGRMIRLGFSYILTGIICSGCELLVRSFIVHNSGLEAAGLYAAGFMLTVTYTRLIFTSMESDYYPRLSAAAGHIERINVAVNRQTDVLVMLMAPMLLLFCIALPILVRVLYTADFVQAIPMVYAAAPYMFFKALAAPTAYLALAHSRSRLYLAVESSYSIVFLLTAIISFHYFGVVGAGFGLSLSNIIYFLTVWTIYGREFGFRFDSATLRRSTIQLLILTIGLAACASSNMWIHYGASTLAFGASALYSLRMFSREIALPTRFAWLQKRADRDPQS